MADEQQVDFWDKPVFTQSDANALAFIDKQTFGRVRNLKTNILTHIDEVDRAGNRYAQEHGIDPRMMRTIMPDPMLTKVAVSLVPDTPLQLALLYSVKPIFYTGEQVYKYGSKAYYMSTLGIRQGRASHAVADGLNSASIVSEFASNNALLLSGAPGPRFLYKYEQVKSGPLVYAQENSVSNAFKIEKLSQNTERSLLHQYNRNVDLTIRSPSAVAIQRGWGELSPRQANLLEQLSKSGKTITIKKNDINVYDLACLTAKTGDEFAMFTLGSRRVILRGNAITTPIPVPLMEKLQAQKWTWSAHTHPANINAPNLTPSGLTGDVGILLELDQEQSMIINSLGKRRVFDLNTVDYADYVDPIPKPRGNQ